MNTHWFPAGLPVDAPVIDPEVTPFWDGTRRGRLVLPFCPGCEQSFWYPRGFCPRCGSSDLEWLEASGRGTVYSYSVVRKAFGEWRDHAPFVIAYVTLGEGVTIPTNLVECSSDQLAVGLEVQALFERSNCSPYGVLRFTPSKSDQPGSAA
jgi:hypothetical protein